MVLVKLNEAFAFNSIGVKPGFDAFSFSSLKSKKCIAASPKAKDDKAEINQYQCNGENHLKWKLVPVNDEQFVIECKNSGKVLTVSDNKIIEDALHDDESQYWIVNEVTSSK